MNRLRRWWLGRRHRGGEWGLLFAPAPAGEWVSLDLETTGLDPARDAVLSLAAVPVRGGQVRLSERFETLVQPGRGFDIESIRHHRLTPEEVAQAPSLEAVLPDFLRWLGPRALLGHHLAFDMAMLDAPVRRLTGFPLPNARVELAQAWLDHRRLEQPRGDINLSLDEITRQLGIPVLGRHTALGDATAVGLAWLALAGRG
ncbi:MAG TPA: exonuclease domain-containing protein [Arenimonas sp.]|uniref:exonuclease domain-containing protein n=1 Tax=Arenimonas sp. TaxID=1872635 RepID=UPI002D80B6B7|nr:exonuclease domain-containing protein [Arenimonas sp.]HEU0153249.1 exonuclease domain-containing protein [Arenimonas sp.]